MKKTKIFLVLASLMLCIGLCFVLTACGNDECTHTYTDSITTEAGCESEGVRTCTCTSCGDSYTEKIAAKGHNYTTSVTQPTCTEKGYTVYTCTCGNTYKDNYVDSLGHTEVIDSAVAPTCTSDGLTEGKHCSVCNETVIAQTVVAALNHDKISHEAKASTCTEIGWNAYATCSRCDYTTYVEKAALDHDLEHHDAKAPTCTEIGWDAYVTCSRCDYTKIGRAHV